MAVSTIIPYVYTLSYSIGIYPTVIVTGVQKDVYTRFFTEAVFERKSKNLKS